jgi:hypothetical protein
VVDEFDTPISGARVTAASGATTRTATTVADGTATVTQVPTGAVTVSATADGFVDSPAQGATVNVNAATPVTIEMVRRAQAAGGVIGATPIAASGDGTSFTFRLRIIVVSQNEPFSPIENLPATAFSLGDCPNAGEHETEGPQLPNCVRGGVVQGLPYDAPYTVVGDGSPNPFTPVDGNLTRTPYAAALLFDSSGSIGGPMGSDPTDARIFASKVFLGGAGDKQVMLSAFADDNPEGNDSLLPDVPLTIFPCTPACATSAPLFTGNGSSLFDALDALAELESGGTPLYASVNTMLAKVDEAAGNLPSPPVNLRRAVVLYSDGDDIYCGSLTNCTDQRVSVIGESDATNVDIITVALQSPRVNSLALAELSLRGDVGSGAYLFAESTQQLVPIYGVLDALLSETLKAYDVDWTVEAGDQVLVPGRAVLGRVGVDAGTTQFTLPFVVQIPQP